MVRAMLTALVMLGVVCVMPGCIAVGRNTHEATVGQELSDLKMALERGAITEGEYSMKKSELLARRN